jgi:DNA-binding MarR family transcriptional regulator
MILCSGVDAGDLYRLTRVLRHVALEATRDSGQAALSPGLVAVTDDIAQHDDTTVAEIVRRTGLAQSLVSSTVARLREAQVVVARTDEHDRRRTRLTISPSARKGIFEERSARSITPSLSDAFPHLSAKQVAAAERLLERLCEELSIKRG